ncbi:MAG: guanylate kinase [Chitinophagales bacterium]
MKKAIIITAPSGAGKSTIASHVLNEIDELEFSVSATTRKIRQDEEEGVDYYFISKEDFLEKIKNEEFVEWEEVYNDVYYGTLKSEVERIWAKDKSVLYVVDVVGAQDLKGYFGNKALSVFIEPPSLEVLKERLQSRGSESEQSLAKRLERAKDEIREKDEFDLVIMNEDLAMAKIQAEDEIRNFLYQD